MSIENKLKYDQENEQMTFIIEREKNNWFLILKKKKWKWIEKLLMQMTLRLFKILLVKN